MKAQGLGRLIKAGIRLIGKILFKKGVKRVTNSIGNKIIDHSSGPMEEQPSVINHKTCQKYSHHSFK